MGLWVSRHVGFRGITLPKETWRPFSQSHHVTAVVWLCSKKTHRPKMLSVWTRIWTRPSELGDMQRVTGRRRSRDLGSKPLHVTAVAQEVALQGITAVALLVI